MHSSEVNKVSHKWWSSLQTAGRADSAAKFETFLVSLIYAEVIREESTKIQQSKHIWSDNLYSKQINLLRKIYYLLFSFENY